MDTPLRNRHAGIKAEGSLDGDNDGNMTKSKIVSLHHRQSQLTTIFIMKICVMFIGGLLLLLLLVAREVTDYQVIWHHWTTEAIPFSFLEELNNLAFLPHRSMTTVHDGKDDDDVKNEEDDGEYVAGENKPHAMTTVDSAITMSIKSGLRTDFVYDADKFAATFETLSRIQTRYFIYDDPELVLNDLHQLDAVYRDPEGYDFLGLDAMADITMIEALKQHPLRTMDPDKAEFFIIPLSLAAVKATLMDAELEKQVYDRALEALQRHRHFRETGGHRHIMVSVWYGHFEHRFHNIPKFKEDAMFSFYQHLWNVTVADYRNKRGIERLYREGQHPDFQDWFQHERIQMTRSTFSVGLLPSHNIPLIKPSFKKFVKSKYFLFYHVRPSKFWTHNSTKFRRAALEKNVIRALPSSSIGFDIPKAKWRRQFRRSKFCLVTRGDDPSTHALLRSVKLGCIPVVVSDAYSSYAPSLSLSISMDDYCLFIPEQEYIKDPGRELSKLTQLSNDWIRNKLKALASTQRILLPDHPESLFVPAFLREAKHAMEQAVLDDTWLTYKQRITA